MSTKIFIGSVKALGINETQIAKKPRTVVGNHEKPCSQEKSGFTLGVMGKKNIRD